MAEDRRTFTTEDVPLSTVRDHPDTWIETVTNRDGAAVVHVGGIGQMLDHAVGAPSPVPDRYHGGRDNGARMDFYESIRALSEAWAGDVTGIDPDAAHAVNEERSTGHRTRDHSDLYRLVALVVPDDAAE